MVHRQIEIDEDTDRMLTELACEYKGNLGLALADLFRMYQSLEGFAESSEAENKSALRIIRDTAEAD